MTLSSETEIAVIIVNYNTAALALQAIESVLTRSHGGRNVEIHLVDNASPTGDGAVLVGTGQDPTLRTAAEGIVMRSLSQCPSNTRATLVSWRTATLTRTPTVKFFSQTIVCKDPKCH